MMIFKEDGMKHIQTQTEWEEEMSGKILSFVRNEIYLDFRYLDRALSVLKPVADASLASFATDGTYLYFSAEQVIRVFKNNPAYLDRSFLHTVMHCLFSHLWIAGGRERQLWNLSCDIVVESVIDGMDKPCTRRILSWQRQSLYERLAGEKGGISAAVVYRIINGMGQEEIMRLNAEFYTDDHRYWPKEERENAMPPQQRAAMQQWQKTARQTRIEQETRGGETEDGEELLAGQLKADKSRRTYREFLQKFTVLREELRCDPDEFDMNYYTYGLRLYRNMPLIEPLESRESRKIHELIIVLDTSFSTSQGLVKNFLKETFDILGQKSSFFEDFLVRIIQCDNQVRMDETVSGHSDFEQMLSDFTVTGGGGTDFRPAFAYVNELIEQGKIKNPGGLLYFTDGLGIYPGKRPKYKTAFLFLEDFDEAAVPPWAMRIRLDEEEFNRIENVKKGLKMAGR